MGKTSKWLRSFLTGKKDKEKCPSNQNSCIAPENPTTPISILQTTPKEKKRWSFRRSSATAAATPKDSISTEPIATTPQAVQTVLDAENEQKKHALAVAVATAAAADAAVADAQAAAAARKALSALKGLVKLQALVRGHLVRKQAMAALRCMQALVTVQARALAQRIRMVDEANPVNQRQSIHRKSTQENQFRHTYHERDKGMEENIKIVEMDLGESKGNIKSRNSYSSNHPQHEREEHRLSTHYAVQCAYSKQDNYQASPVPSALTDMSPRACSGHFEDYSFSPAQSSPQYYSAVSKPDPSRIPFAFPKPDYAETMSYDYPLFPNYMSNTESSRAKARSQSAPKQRPPDSFERQPSRRRVSMEGRNVPRAVKMQRSSSHVGSTAQNYQYPWSIKLDKSTVSLKDSECGSTSTVLTNINYCRSLAAYDFPDFSAIAR
uniref:DUF4005 domain-containing protein n=1 Tax=Fagus sylvatica TaxID=28930 RepID=A0A2N9F4M9_FAGSY